MPIASAFARRFSIGDPSPADSESSMKPKQKSLHLLAVVVAMFAGFLFAGCDNKETVLDVNPPGGGVDVDQ